MKKLMTICTILAGIFLAKPAFACNDDKHGHPKGAKCDRDTVAQTQQQGQGQTQTGTVTGSQTTTVTSNPTATSNSNSSATGTGTATATTGPVNAAGGAATANGGNSTATGGTSSATTGDQSQSVGNTSTQVGVSADITTGGSTSSATTGNNTNNNSAEGGAGGEGGKAEMNGSGNGGGATVNNTSINNNKTLVFSPVQPPPLPATIAVGGISLVKSEECGPRVKVKSFSREAHVPQVFGLWQKSIDVQTMHGLLEGFDDENPFIVRRFKVPAPYNREVVMVIGHQLYIAVGWDGQGGGSSGAGSYAGEKALGIGLGLSANSSLGVVGVVALPCVYDPNKALQPVDLEVTVKKAEITETETKPALEVDKVKVRSDTGKFIKRKKMDQKQLCGAGPDEECVWSSDRVEVVKDAKLK